MLRNRALVVPKSNKAQQIFNKYLNNKNEVIVEEIRGNRVFCSAPDYPDFWFWVDRLDGGDDNWKIQLLNNRL